MLRLLFFVLICGLALVVTAYAQQPLDAQSQCAAKYEAAKAGGTIGDISRKDFLKVCVISTASTAPASASGDDQQPSSTAVEPTAAPAVYTDPVAYCRGVVTVDYPMKDPRYAGPRSEEKIHDALHVLRPLKGVVDNRQLHLSWRCLDGKALVCIAWKEYLCGNAQVSARKEEERVLADRNVVGDCQQKLNSDCAAGTHCMVGCREGLPVFNRNGSRPRAPQDARGFVPGMYTAADVP
jgi:hypothetical protein